MYEQAVTKARAAEYKAIRRANQLADQAARQLDKHPVYRRLPEAKFQAMVDTIVMARKQIDPIWKDAVADNQWYLAQAGAYGPGRVAGDWT
jgi:cell division protein FtsN